MAIDTRDKRASAGGIGPLALSFPTPDGTVTAADRKQVAALYRIPDADSGGGGGGTVIMRTWKIAYPG